MVLTKKVGSIDRDRLRRLIEELKEENISYSGALFKLDKRVEKPDKAMTDEVSGKRLWDELVKLTGLNPE